ncbi:hypothetical protein J6590_077907, partial [Homalodisca vitripennis]
MSDSWSDSCPVCVKMVLDTEEGIGCDGDCQRWFHRECIKMSKAEYQSKCADTKNKWYCARTDCLGSSNQPFRLLSSQMSIVLTKLDDLLGK